MDDNHCPSSTTVGARHAVSFFGQLQKMRWEGLLVDVTLCAEGKEVSCHRLVLAANSEYFRVMFNGKHSESKKDKIEMGGVSAEALQLLVDHAYTSRVNITEENVRPLFEAADMLQFYGVSSDCQEFLRTRVKEETCLGIWTLADRVSCLPLAKTAKSCALKWFEEVCATEEFLQLPVHLLKTYISDKGLMARKEERILEVVMLWARQNLKERQKHLKELLKSVCFSRMDQDYLKNILKTDKVLAKVRGIKQMTKSQPTQDRPRHILQQDILLLGGSCYYHTEMELRYHWNNGVYRLGLDSHCIDRIPLPEPFQNSRGLAACVYDGHVTVTGGHKKLTQAWRYTPKLNSWVKLGRLKTGRYNHGMTVLQREVYVVGGSMPVQYPDIIHRLPDVEVYNKRFNHWRLVAPLQLAVSSFGIATCGGKIYVFGGQPYVYDGDDLRENETDAIQCYDPSQNEWAINMRLPVKMSSVKACTVNSKIYIVGGKLECVLCFDPEQESFKVLADRLFPWQQCSATVCNGEIYITGGMVHQFVGTGNDRLRHIENYAKVQCYNVNNDTMVLSKDLPEPLYGHCTVTIAKA
ncbi:kelch-like protein 24 [Branchiostoma lanceolatum]|uniref:kelch-like protein 24 n=1 Tax=Branchiostoma lanceolatum TaxID=7740 RepID=UPI003456AF30